MLHVAEAFAPLAGHRFLRGLPPQVVALDSRPHELRLDVGVIRIPPEHGGGTVTARSYNPAIARAPRGLCPRCAFVATLRVDSLHQCGSGTNTTMANGSAEHWVKRNVARTNFRTTALLVLDAQLRILAWTWYLACPEVQVAAVDSQWVSGGWACPLGAGGSFQPPWAKGVFDARLLRVAGRLLITSSCRGCEGGIKWSQLQLTGDVAADGGLTNLRAWAVRTFVSERRRDKRRWAAGRNQALFAIERTGSFEMLAQPWLGMVATFGTLEWVQMSVHCARGISSARRFSSLDSLVRAYCSLFQWRWWDRWERRGARPGHRAGLEICGPTPTGTLLSVDALRPTVPQGDQLDLQLIANDSLPELSGMGFRLSTTANLVRIRRPGYGARCEAYLGVGHLHRGDGPLNRLKNRKTKYGTRAQRRAAAQPQGHAFLFGYACEWLLFETCTMRMRMRMRMCMRVHVLGREPRRLPLAPALRRHTLLLHGRAARSVEYARNHGRVLLGFGKCACRL